jgi:HEAT repeat protein
MSGTTSGYTKDSTSAHETLYDRQILTLYDALEADNIEFAIKVIGFMGDSKNLRAVGPLTVLLEYPDQAIQAHSAIALGQIGDKEAIPHLVEALGKTTDKVKVSIVTALGMFGDNSVIKPIESILLTPDEPKLINAVRSTVYKLNHPDSKEKA